MLLHAKRETNQSSAYLVRAVLIGGEVSRGNSLRSAAVKNGYV